MTKTVRSMLLMALALCLTTVTGCNREQDTGEFLAPLAELAQGAITEADSRIDKASKLLAGDVAAAPPIAKLLGTGSGDGTDDTKLNWDNTPYIAVGVVNPAGELLGIFPHGSNGFTDLLKKAVAGPDTGDLMIIPNTFSFTMPLRHAPKGSKQTLVTLLDVDRVLLDGVLKPVAAAAGGYAFLANRDQRVILATHPALIGQPLSKWHIPVAAPGQQVTGRVTLAGIDSYIATATSTSENGWIVGVTVPVVE